MGETAVSRESGAQTSQVMPAEWAAHRRTWMCWPCRVEAWGSTAQMEQARTATARVARAIARFEPVVMIARPNDAEGAGRACGGIAEIFVTPIDDSWARDTGPTFLSDLAGVTWRFNAWGEKYIGYENDRALGGRILDRTGATVLMAPLVCEGGAIHVDGEGTLITTEQCLLNRNRNPEYSRDEVSAILCRHTGAHSVLWLPGEFADVETDGHVDNVACFASPGRILLGIPPVRHPDFAAVASTRQFLIEARDAKGRSFEIVDLAQPERMREDWRGRPLGASYVNFYLCNGAVIMPGFDDPADLSALAVLRHCFPDREVVQIEAHDLVEGGGGIHCITQQEPL